TNALSAGISRQLQMPCEAVLRKSGGHIEGQQRKDRRAGKEKKPGHAGDRSSRRPRDGRGPGHAAVHRLFSKTLAELTSTLDWSPSACRWLRKWSFHLA